MYGARNSEVSPLAPPVLVSLADVKTYLGISGSADDAALTAMILAVSWQIEKFCNRFFSPRTVTERIEAEDDFTHIILAHAPVTAVTSIAFAGTAETVGDWLRLETNGTLVRNDGGNNSPTVVTVVYTAGYASVPPAVTQAVKDAMSSAWTAKSLDPTLTSESVPDVGSVTYASGADGRHKSGLPWSVVGALSPFRARF